MQVTGSTDPIRKVAPGGWSQRRYQQRAENTWEHNADDVAHTVVDLVHRTEARVLLIGGDVRATALLRDALPTEVRAMIVDVAATRAADGSSANTSASVAQALETISGHDTTEVLEVRRGVRAERPRVRRCRGDRRRAAARAGRRAAAHGERAPRSHRVVLHGRHTDRAEGERPRDLRCRRADGSPLVDVLARAALGTAAGVRIVANSSLFAEGAGALLRWR